MITSDRLAELETLAIDPDVHDAARFSVPARDLRDLVACAVELKRIRWLQQNPAPGVDREPLPDGSDLRLGRNA